MPDKVDNLHHREACKIKMVLGVTTPAGQQLQHNIRWGAGILTIQQISNKSIARRYLYHKTRIHSINKADSDMYSLPIKNYFGKGTKYINFKEKCPKAECGAVCVLAAAILGLDR